MMFVYGSAIVCFDDSSRNNFYSNQARGGLGFGSSTHFDRSLRFSYRRDIAVQLLARSR